MSLRVQEAQKMNKKNYHHILWQTIQFVYQLSMDQVNIWSSLSRVVLLISKFHHSHKKASTKHTNYTQIEIILRHNFILIGDKVVSW